MASAGLSSGQTKDLDYDRILTILFPETASWIPLKTMPRLGWADVKKIAPELTKAYLESKIDKASEGPECSFIQRLFAERDFQYFHNSFYRFDIDKDGADDIVYSGQHPCLTADGTIIWFGGKDGTDHFMVRQRVVWPMETLRIVPGTPPLVGSVAVNCCAALDDDYFTGDFDNLRWPGHRKILKRTVIPSSVLKPMKFTTPDQELVLRSSPAVDDEYNKGFSEYISTAVFGNILARYLPGCSGTIVGQDKKEGGELWYFVLLDEDCKSLRTHNPYDVNAGWISASHGIFVQ